MSDTSPSLGAIARWLQQEDDELLYTPDGARSTPVTSVIESTPSHARGWVRQLLTPEDVSRYFAVPAQQLAPEAAMVQERVRECYAVEAGQWHATPADWIG